MSRPRFGYLHVLVMLKSEGWAVGNKRVYRLYRLEGLQLRMKVKRRKRIALLRGRRMGAALRSRHRVRLRFDSHRREALVAPDLSVPGHREVFVVGDMASVTVGGTPVPGVAPAANQMGDRAARNVVATLRGEPRQPFKYLNKGDLATIGRHKAVARFGRFELEGYLAWFLWLFVHIMYLVGFRNRLSVLLQWAYAYLTYHRGVRLISGEMTRRYSTATPAERPAASPTMPGW